MANGNHKSYFFNSLDGDRKYDAESFSDWLRNFFTNGVFNGGFSITPAPAGEDNALNVKISEGYGFINGKVCRYFSPTVLTFELSTAGHRTDSVVLRLDTSGTDIGRDIYLTVIKGTEASSAGAAAPPKIVRDNYYYDLKICDVFIPYAAVEILPENIIDTRLDSTVCGIVAQAVSSIDGTSLFSQLQAFLVAQYAKYNNLWSEFLSFDAGKRQDADIAFAAFADFLAGLQAELRGQFQSWFNEIKSLLSEDAVAGVVVDVNELKNAQPTVVVANIEHGLGGTPTSVRLYSADCAFGLGGAGDTPFGGYGVAEVPCLTAYNGADNIYDVVTIIAPPAYSAYTTVNKITDNFYAVYTDDEADTESLSVIIA